MRILVADDDQMLVTMLSSTFEKWGWEALAALDAMQAFMLAKQEPPPDMILLDIFMPGGSGLTVLERLKAVDITAEIPVVVVSASTDPEMHRTAREMGAIAFVQKPVDPEEVARAIDRYFAQER